MRFKLGKSKSLEFRLFIIMLVATVINWGHVHAGNIFLVPGATVATLLMLGALHARRLYDDKKVYYSLSSTYFFQVFFKHKCS